MLMLRELHSHGYINDHVALLKKVEEWQILSHYQLNFAP